MGQSGSPEGRAHGKGDVVDIDAYSRLYEQSHAVLVGQVFVVTTDRIEAEEAVQEAFTRLWERRIQVGGYDNLEAWVRRVAINIAIKRWHRARRGERLIHLIEAQPDDEGETAAAVERADLVDGLRRLPVTHRHALLLHYVLGLSVREVADEMSTGLSPVRPGTVKSWLHRGRAELSKALTNEEADDV
jgi:RNA polymerase sigma-70 factor (ECF subfamily)